MCEHKFWLGICIVIAVGIILLVGTCSYYSMMETVKMAELGYQEDVVPGRGYPVWQKVECTPAPKPKVED